MNIMNRDVIMMLMALLLLPLLSHARDVPPVRHDSRISYFIYDKNDVYDLNVHESYFTIIHFSKTEFIRKLEFGSPAGWYADWNASDPRVSSVLLKTMNPNMCTNLNIQTTLRDYIFNVCSKSMNDSPESRTYSVNFIYPDSMENDSKDDDSLYAHDMHNSNMIRGDRHMMSSERHMDNMYDRYRISGDDDVSPESVYSKDGNTYFYFPPRSKNPKKLPYVAEVSSSGRPCKA